MQRSAAGAAFAVAADNLALGRSVIADSVNPWMLSRDAWREVGIRANVPVREIEVVCSDADPSAALSNPSGITLALFVDEQS